MYTYKLNKNVLTFYRDDVPVYRTNIHPQMKSSEITDVVADTVNRLKTQII